MKQKSMFELRLTSDFLCYSRFGRVRMGAKIYTQDTTDTDDEDFPSLMFLAAYDIDACFSSTIDNATTIMMEMIFRHVVQSI